MSSPLPTGLMPHEIGALRVSAGVTPAAFAAAFGVDAESIDGWETFGVPTGPTALAIRLVAQSMDFDFPDAALSDDTPCVICATAASISFGELAVCQSCHRDPAASLVALGCEVTKTPNTVASDAVYEVHLPAGRQFRYSGRFLGEGLGTMLTKLFKNEPQLGERRWDDAVYVQWIEPDLDAIGGDVCRELIRALVAFGMVDISPTGISVQNVPAWGTFDGRIFLLCGLLASLSS